MKRALKMSVIGGRAFAAGAAALISVLPGVAVAEPDPPPVLPCNHWSASLPVLGQSADVPFTYGVIEVPPGQFRWGRKSGAPYKASPPAGAAWPAHPDVPSDDRGHQEWRLWNREYLPSCWESLVDLSGESTAGVVPPLTFPAPVAPAIGATQLPNGFRLNFDLMASPSIGDYLPPGAMLSQSSVALLPSSSAHAPTGWQGMSRPTLEGQIDLVTGLPLARVVDLELPFGGSTFRLTRTRSAYEESLDGVSTGFGARNVTVDKFHEHERWWDWVGQGWMAGENPFLIIDSALPDVVGPNPRTMYLVLDAHHSIPFQRVLLSGSGLTARVGYEAPPRFRARMEHNGLWGQVTGPAGTQVQGWVVAPTQYDVWLYDGALRYTFVAIRDDVPPNVWDPRYGSTAPPQGGHPRDEAPWKVSSFHDYQLSGQYWNNAYGNNEKTPGFGIPHYGICVRIQDLHGNAVEIDYCDVSRTAAANSSLTPPVTETPATCVECQELGLRKGQIKAVRLTSNPAGGSRVVHWTLLYVHRLFAGSSVFENSGTPPEEFFPAGDEDTPALRGDIAIDRIYLYAGSPFTPENTPCLTIGSRTNPYRETETIRNEAGAEHTISNTWQHQVRYYYRPENWTTATLPPIPPSGHDAYKPTSTPILAMTEVTSRRPIDGSPTAFGPATTRHTFFRYTPREERPTSKWHWLERIYADREYGTLLAWAKPIESGQVDPVPLGLRGLRDRVRAALRPIDFAFGDLGGATAALEAAHGGENHDVIQAHLHKMATVSLAAWEGGLVACAGGEGHLPGTSQSPPVSGFITGFNDSDQRTHTYISVLASVPERNGLFAVQDINQVQTASVRDGDGTPKHYRVFHFIATPRSNVLDSSKVSCPATTEWSQIANPLAAPNRSFRFHPYRWFATPVPTGGTGWPVQWPPEQYGNIWTDAADLSQPRWIRVIDEFDSPEDRDSSEVYSSSGPFTKPGQISRRVVTMNAAGYVLTDKVWTFADGNTLASGTGLGEQFIYQSGQTLFQSVVLDPPPAGDPKLPPEDPYAAVRREMLLVEHRSVGWSATSGNDNGIKGLVRRFEYDLVPAATNQKPVARLRSEWIQSGTLPAPLSKRYTKHLFYHESGSGGAPTDLAMQAIPLTDAAATVS